jgi:hypothetical protein
LGVLASRYGEEWLHVAMKKVSSGFLIGSLVLLGGFIIFRRIRAAWKASRPALGPKPEEGK